MSGMRPGGPVAAPGGGLALVHAVNAAWNALTYVYDPELYLDVVSLGLVYDVRDEDGTIVVEMTLTTPGCPASESLPEMARAAVAEAVGDVTAVDVRIVWDPPWSPAMIDNVAAEALGFRIR
ncbi:MAG TPA: iron-sulfur cluster assembly protein [Streptosporangiaceae bacterium]|nr:iron-sulfur cluster assembly protein [Streptosporangiaceae bacterium]